MLKVSYHWEPIPDFSGAVEYPHGTKQWCLNGKRHREDGPAYEGADGSKKWYLNGKLHRVDGPACEYTDGTKAWYLNGERHREDGPAYEGADGSKEWFLNGKFIHGKNPHYIWFFQVEKLLEKKEIDKDLFIPLNSFFLDICGSQIEFLNVVREDGVWRVDKQEWDTINA